MSPTAAEVLKQALALEESDRASLAGALVESLEPAPESGAAGAWEAVVRRRLGQLDAGSVSPVPWSEVRECLFRGYE